MRVRVKKFPSLSYNNRGKRLAKFFDWCQKKGAKQFIYLSTVHVYGSVVGVPMIEGRTNNAQNPYSTSHRIAERCLERNPLSIQKSA